MAKRDVLADYGVDREAVEQEVEQSLMGLTGEELEKTLDESVKDYSVNTILEGRIVSITDDEVMVDVGYKSEGAIPKHEWENGEELAVGDTCEVLLEAVEDEEGLVQLSKRKADRIRNWERVVTHHEEGGIVTGTVMRKIKGGLLVDIGVPVFLPASQVDIRRPGEIADYIGERLTCTILKIDEGRRNIVVSRRQLIEEQREAMKVRVFENLEVGEIRPGKVKNIVDFGAFVDLGGIDGLLHITDMSWGRISHPSEMVAIDDLIEVVILSVDPERERVALGLKQKTPSPWENIGEKYPVGSEVSGEVVNLMSYGAFVKLEEGVEGLVHISEMSWTRRINHPSELVAIGDIVDVVVLGIDKEKEEISLGMKQTEQNPWELVEENYPPGTEVVGRVRNLTSYGAFVEIEEGIDGLLHVSDMSWTRKVSHPTEVVQKGDTIKCVVLEVDPQKRRVALGLKQLEEDPWKTEIPERYQSGDLVRGIITKLTSFGAFVELEDGLEGLLHISELSEKKIPSPEEIVEVGDVVDVRVIRVDAESRKIGLSLRSEGPVVEEEERPRIVLRSDQVEAAEDPEELVEEAMEEAPQFEERPEQPEQSSGATSGLEIPTGTIGEESPEEESVAEEPAAVPLQGVAETATEAAEAEEAAAEAPPEEAEEAPEEADLPAEDEEENEEEERE
ncbi:MAG: 30S ribosomal protein S1 [Planctomycetota bacterium]